MERGLRMKTNPIDDYIGSKDLAWQIYDIILEDYEFCLVPHHTDQEYAHYFDNKLMKIYNTIKPLLEKKDNGTRTT